MERKIRNQIFANLFNSFYWLRQKSDFGLVNGTQKGRNLNPDADLIQIIQYRGWITWITIQDWILGESDKWNAKSRFRL